MKRETYHLELFCDNSPQEHEIASMRSPESMKMCVRGCRAIGWVVTASGALCPACSGLIPRLRGHSAYSIANDYITVDK